MVKFKITPIHCHCTLYFCNTTESLLKEKKKEPATAVVAPKKEEKRDQTL
jgi:hypothetical protein